MSVGHLVIEMDFWRNGPGQSTAAIEALYKSLRNGIAFTDVNIVLANQFIIGQMSVTETINGMACASFGQEWLLSERDQVCAHCVAFVVVTILLWFNFRYFRWHKRLAK